MIIIVESPTKAKKIQKYFKDGTIVLSSCGHINNLAQKNLGIDIDKKFKPTYEYLKDKKDVIKQLKERSLDKKVILAADDDREGDAIAWHCGNLLKVDFKKKNRIIFREINETSVKKSLTNIHKINMNSVYSQQARQIIDKLIGFKLSPLLWENIQTDQKGLSAGRVQSTLLLILKNLEDSIQNFESTSKYNYNAEFLYSNSKINCQLILKDSSSSPIDILTSLQKNKKYNIISIKEKNINDYPPKPLITTTLQQEAYNTFGFSIKKTMMIAQKLFENGKITYMRTDSTFISEEFKRLLETYINDQYTSEYYNDPKEKMKKVKGALTDLHYQLNEKYSEDDKKLYQMIKKRTIMSHMKPAIYNQMTFRLSNKQLTKIGIFEGKHKNLIYDGYLKYNKIQLTDKLDIDSKTQFSLDVAECKETFTNPPGYYNESSLVKKLETSGIGRPSTYASIVSTLYNRNYTIVKNIDPIERSIEKYTLCSDNEIIRKQMNEKSSIQKNKILLTPLGHQVLQYLLTHFDNIINIQFTSIVESDLDLISEGSLIWHEVVQKVYNSFYQKVDRLLKNKPFPEINLGKYKNKKVLLKKGPYGPYINWNKKNKNIGKIVTRNNLELNSIKLKDIQFMLN